MKIRFAHPALADRLTLNGQMEVCGCCNGQGRTFRADLDENRLVESLWADGDQDGLESYYAGSFDQTCFECKGRNVVESVDWEDFKNSHPREYRAVQAYNDDADSCRREKADEARYFNYGS